MRTPVFTYGTLKEGFPNFGFNGGIRVGGEFVTMHRFPLYLVGPRRVPWLVNLPGQGERVVGQLFEIDDAGLLQMDALERVDASDGYRRLAIEVVERNRPGATPVVALAYVKLPEQLAEQTIRVGPLFEYTLEHASLYTPRDA
jgi:gamma-glutamylaminecyclotransferase